MSEKISLGGFLSNHRHARFYIAEILDKIISCLCKKPKTHMRHEFETILGEELRYLAIETRDRMNLTQKEMGALLYMSESSYSDIETGETKCVSALTETILLNLQEDPAEFLRNTEKRFIAYYQKAMQPV